MSYVRTFKGFAGVRLEADDIGSADDPSIILLHGAGQTRQVWEDVAIALHQAGRHVINIDLRGHGQSEWPEDGRYDFDAFVEDLRAVLAQMRTRPVVVAATLAGWIATAALAEDAAMLAAGLVLVDLPTTADPAAARATADKLRGAATASVGSADYDVRMLDRFDIAGVLDRVVEAAAKVNIPVLFVRGALSDLDSNESAAAFVRALPDAEAVEVEESGLLINTERTESFNGLLLDFLERKQPRFVPEFREGSDARTFRDALGCFATGVTIITAMGPDGIPIGLTANSFTSVSLDPPLLLVCIANGAGSAPVLQTAKRFAVNVLQIGQQPTSNRFAGKGEDRFAATPWEVGEFGTPVLTGSLSSFECERDALHDGGDHFILVGRVLKAMFEPRRDPLLYFRGKYRRLHFA
jgi:flavin reductase (DIM6/NTAB) family NADH-FMN oxidoreductase RutF/pimeloyl-ACP methyl ester carboxylesterase